MAGVGRFSCTPCLIILRQVHAQIAFGRPYFGLHLLAVLVSHNGLAWEWIDSGVCSLSMEQLYRAPTS